MIAYESAKKLSVRQNAATRMKYKRKEIDEGWKRLVQFVCSEITQGLYFMRRIGDLNLYYLSSILLSRRNEVEFNFRIRKEIEQVLLD